jgi:hypothetical protein
VPGGSCPRSARAWGLAAWIRRPRSSAESRPRAHLRPRPSADPQRGSTSRDFRLDQELLSTRTAGSGRGAGPAPGLVRLEANSHASAGGRRSPAHVCWVTPNGCGRARARPNMGHAIPSPEPGSPCAPRRCWSNRFGRDSAAVCGALASALSRRRGSTPASLRDVGDDTDWRMGLFTSSHKW